MVPEGWRQVRLGDHVKIHAGYAPASLNISDDGNVPYVKVDDLNNCARVQTDSKARAKFDGRKLPVNTIIFPKRGAAIMNNKVRIAGMQMILDTNMMGLEAKATLDPWFAYYRLLHEQLFKIADTSTIPQINNKHINPYVIELPPLPEQKKIADILSTWDKAIETIGKLLANAERQKRALMQQLLTGKRRLKGFDGEWCKSPLGALGETYGGLTGKSKDDFGSGVPYITYMMVFGNSSIELSQIDRVKVGTGERQHRVKRGDIFFTTSSETPDEVGMASVLLDEPGECYLNSFCFGYRLLSLEKLVPEFARHLLREAKFRRDIRELAQGATRYNLSKRALMKLEVSLPSVVEQQQIATVLDDADEIVRALRSQQLRLETEKRALMQQLLTGKRRVTV